MFENDEVIAVSNAALVAYHHLRTNCSLSTSFHQCVVYNGCRIPPQGEHNFLIDREKINIAFCGKFELQKGIDILIERIRTINHRYENVFLFHMVGAGTYQKEVDELAKQSSNVLLYDAVPEIANQLHAFDFVIMPSRFEGLGLVSIEASFSKTPVIISRVPGLDETIPEDWPLQFHLDNSDELLAIFENIANHKYPIESLKEKAFGFVSKKFPIDSMIEKYAKIYADSENNQITETL